MRWKPFKGGVPYTCQECPAFVDMRDDRDRWESLARYLCDAVPSGTVIPDRFAQLFPVPLLKDYRND